MVVIILMISIMPTVMKPIIPLMFWPIVGVFMAIIDIIPSEYTPGMFSDLPLNSGMLL